MDAMNMTQEELRKPENNRWPGYRMGLPEEGPGSIGGIWRRILAFLFDNVCAGLIAQAFFPKWWLAPITVFAVVQIVSIAIVSASPGHALFGLRLRTVQGRRAGLWRPILRTIMLCLVLPALVWDTDHRGLHDIFSGTVLVRR